jgi:MFS family permease
VAFKGRLWKHQDFLKFWTGDTVTQFTGQITDLALPTVAVLTLQVTAFQLGILNALGFIAFPVLGLFVGVWMDRARRRPVMIVVNLIEVAVLATVPVAFILGVLSLYQLYVVALVMGTCTLFFDVAYQSYLPSLVEREDVVEGNQKLQTSASAAQVAGPSVASGLMQVFGAALSIAADALGTFIATLVLISIKKPEPKPERSAPGDERHFFTEMREGIKVVVGNKLLWTQAGCTGTANLGSNIFGVAVLLYAYRTLGISKGIIGIAFSMGAMGFLVGVLVSSAFTRRLGLGRAIAASIAFNFALLLVLLANGTFSVLILGASFFISYFGTPIYNINQVSLRQIITPNRLQGRMNATMRTIVWGTIPAGSLLGGVLSTSLGITPTLVVGALVSGISVLWIVLGPTFKLQKQPAPASD